MPDTYLNGRVAVTIGDITSEQVDVIVNAANSSLLGGGGVDGAIHRAGGPTILKACHKLRETAYPSGLPTGEAVATTAGNLHARYVIHTVGPVWYGGSRNERTLLEACYTNSLAVATNLGCATVAFPAISTGVYGFPRDLAASVSSKAIAAALVTNETVKLVQLVFFNHDDAEVFQKNQAFTQSRRHV